MLQLHPTSGELRKLNGQWMPEMVNVCKCVPATIEYQDQSLNRGRKANSARTNFRSWDERSILSCSRAYRCVGKGLAEQSRFQEESLEAIGSICGEPLNIWYRDLASSADEELLCAQDVSPAGWSVVEGLGAGKHRRRSGLGHAAYGWGDTCKVNSHNYNRPPYRRV